MYNVFKQAGIGFLLSLICIASFAQERTVRPDDHFWRKRIVHRISLIEKINQPLVYHASSYYSGDGPYKEMDGIVVSLIHGVQQGKYPAYHPDDWNHKMNYADLRARMTKFEEAYHMEEEYLQDEDQQFSSQDLFEVEDDDLFSTEEDTPPSTEKSWNEEEVWPFENWEESGGEKKADFEEAEVIMELDPMDFSNYEQVIHMVEDRIFDKGTSEMVHDIQFFELIWRDPAGTLPEQVLARFKWDDVKEQLNQTAWKNRFNDAETKSMREIMAFRRFNSIMINVGDQPIRTLHEAIRRKQELVEFEHHLWSY